ncbi:MAG: efflux RND transporter periplasmic adaptor subunit [Pseudomonadota bacterium]
MTDDAKTQKPGLLRRVGRATVRTVLTLGVAAPAIVAVQMGSQELGRRADAAPAPDAAPAMPVEVAPIVLSPGYEVTRSFIGQIEATRTAAVSFELPGRLSEILVDEGDTVAEGQHVATLDTRLLNAERERLEASKAALEAQRKFAEQTVARQENLSDRGFASQAALDAAVAATDDLRSRIAEVDAALLSNGIQVEKSKVYAPFSGRVTERLVDGGESVSPSQGLVEIVEDGAPRLRVGVPLDITEADLAAAVIEIDGVPSGARLISLRPDVDAVTRTRTAIFEVSGEAGVTFGQTARLLLSDTVEMPGIWVPVTTLKEGQRGQWTLLAVDGENTVRSMTVQVVHSAGDQVFVRGAFPKDAQLITTGPQRVTVGQTVDPRTQG